MSRRGVPLSPKVPGRSELISWVNRLLSLKYKRIEDVSNGAAFCQLVDVVHPNTVPLARVNFRAKLPHESMENLKILQETFTKNNILEPVDVSACSRGHYTATLHLLQYLHQYITMSGCSTGYDGPARRRHFHCTDPDGRPPPKGPGLATSVKGVPVLNKSLKLSLRATHGDAAPSLAPGSPDVPAGEGSGPSVGELQKAVTSLKKGNQKLKEEVDLMTQERDFYYEKLRKVEDFCQDNERPGDDTYQKILDILYETDSANGFVAPDDCDEEEEIGSDLDEDEDF
jgi:RP/EB family microtubule-associated protein